MNRLKHIQTSTSSSADALPDEDEMNSISTRLRLFLCGVKYPLFCIAQKNSLLKCVPCYKALQKNIITMKRNAKTSYV